MSETHAKWLRTITGHMSELSTDGNGKNVREGLRKAADALDAQARQTEALELELAAWKQSSDLKAARIADLEAAQTRALGVVKAARALHDVWMGPETPDILDIEQRAVAAFGEAMADYDLSASAALGVHSALQGGG